MKGAIKETVGGAIKSANLKQQGREEHQLGNAEVREAKANRDHVSFYTLLRRSFPSRTQSNQTRSLEPLAMQAVTATAEVQDPSLGIPWASTTITTAATPLEAEQ